MTDHDRARECYRLACAVSDVKGRRNGARPWLARVAGYSALTARSWRDDGWPEPARKLLAAMEGTHPRHWPAEWRI